MFGAEVEGQAVHVSGQAEGLLPAMTYRFCAVAFNPETGEASIGQELSFATLAVKPSIDAESDSNVTSTGASLEAQVNPNNQETSYHFLYATDEALSGAVSLPGASALPASYGDQAVSVDLEGRLVPYTTYYYRVVAENATGTTEGPVQSFMTTAPPVLTTGQAQEVVRAAATIAGTVDPAGLETKYYFQYGTTTSYGQNAPSVQGVSLPIGFGALPVSVRIEDLVPGTVYHYRIAASNREGTTYSPDETLTTGSPTPPTVRIEGASNVTLTTATLTAAIEPKGLETSYVLELGTGTTYETSIAGEVGSSSRTIEVPVFELAPSTTYHYRFVAVNPDGRVYGSDQMFTTPIYEHPIVLPTAEPLLGVPAVAFPAETANTARPTVKRKTKTKHKRRKRGKKHKHTRNRKARIPGHG